MPVLLGNENFVLSSIFMERDSSYSETLFKIIMNYRRLLIGVAASKCLLG